ncbi:MARVEL domain-containing protein 2 isoform X2 [Apteryx mantelli]|uniref:MARVEL domain-containing protein 2 isoform X2 n=1 Tax=Apteryx mantelli TaxID=2696672 RepID=A0ABM4G2M7_9AVES
MAGSAAAGGWRRPDEEPLDSEEAATPPPAAFPPPPLPLQPPCGPGDGAELKPVRRFVPDSWKSFFRGKRRESRAWGSAASDVLYAAAGAESSPPPSPAAPPAASWRAESEAVLRGEACGAAEAAYGQRYAYMRSWAGLLRVLCVAELLLGAAVFACVSAYVHKDNEWYNMFGYSQPYGFAAGGAYGGYYYGGPKTPFVLVAAGVAWIVTIVLLVLGMSVYYRTILLDSNWWPLTEFGINVALFFLYMAAAIVYVNDINRGGLCYYPLFKTPINASFCRVEGGQTAAIIFLFVTVVLYLISAVVALKLWRHEGARRHRELMAREMKTQSSLSEKKYESVDRPREEITYRQLKSVEVKPERLNGHIPAGHIPKPIVMPDYLAKYPAIQTNEMRDRYKAVFNDQFAEYKELSGEVHAVLRKFDELDALMRKLPHNPGSIHEQERISRVLQEYKKKKNPFMKAG